jgi:SAM-dependent methyltransferase
MSAPAHPLLALLDCPACRRDEGLSAQALGGRAYLACARCRFWYPVREEVPVLLVPERNPEGLRRPLEAEAPLPLERRPPAFTDLKLLAHGFLMRLDEFGRGFAVDREPVVVDVGCSTGSLAAWLGPDQTYLGLDLSFPSLRFARRGTGQFFVQADAARLPLRTGAVPFLAAREVLEHLEDPLSALRELARVGRRGVVVVPTREFPFPYDPLNWVLVRRGRQARFGGFGYGHRHLPDIAGWRALLERAGLRVRRERPIGTGLLLNASDVLWHSLYSWRDFDHLPRRSLPVPLARALLRLGRLFHRLDAALLPGRTASQAFEVEPAGIC